MGCKIKQPLLSSSPSQSPKYVCRPWHSIADTCGHVTAIMCQSAELRENMCRKFVCVTTQTKWGHTDPNVASCSVTSGQKLHKVPLNPALNVQREPFLRFWLIYHEIKGENLIGQGSFKGVIPPLLFRPFLARQKCLRQISCNRQSGINLRVVPWLRLAWQPW